MFISISKGSSSFAKMAVPTDQASAPRLVKERPWYVLSCLWDDAYKRTLAASRK